jgi:hypothetical protein
MGADGLHCKHIREIGKFQISPSCPHLIQECCQGLVVGDECTICFCVVFLQFTQTGFNLSFLC